MLLKRVSSAIGTCRETLTSFPCFGVHGYYVHRVGGFRLWCTPKTIYTAFIKHVYITGRPTRMYSRWKLYVVSLSLNKKRNVSGTGLLSTGNLVRGTGRRIKYYIFQFADSIIISYGTSLTPCKGSLSHYINRVWGQSVCKVFKAPVVVKGLFPLIFPPLTNSSDEKVSVRKILLDIQQIPVLQKRQGGLAGDVLLGASRLPLNWFIF